MDRGNEFLQLHFAQVSDGKRTILKSKIMNTQEKLKLINEILEKTDVSIQDDYFEDIFKDENNVEIFRVMSSRLLSKYPERENDLLDEIIENLNKYLKLTAMSKG